MAMRGGCLCGAVRYTVAEPPSYQLICVCSQCQVIGGGFGVGSVVVPKEALMVEPGRENLCDFSVPESSVAVVRQFCRTCGTHLFASNATFPVVAVHAGTLSDPALFVPQVALWCQSKRAWHRLPEGVAEFDQYPPPQPQTK
eukprot:TRINITY_DN21921_c0_g1_i1.p1 TRINITY_DN21921_c0_g1~~TRINITY_DN21921_c0_g1_i1.p1  ORF type:complete len:142 (+),score=8.64 TRINITY_DN21921_c0_g1_i1:181-606(+)